MRIDDARRLLNDDDLKEVFGLMREKYRKQFESADPQDKDNLQVIRLKLGLIKDFYAQVNKVLNKEITND